MDQCWVDDFFNEGKLRLTAFSQFRTYTDEQRGDENEGLMHMVCKDVNGSTHNTGFVFNQPAYVLCGSTVESKDIMHNFHVTSGFRILDTAAFGRAIARSIPFLQEGVQGHCMYREDSTVRRKDTDIFPFHPPTSEEDCKRISDAHHHYLWQLNRFESFFVKKPSFAGQNEYRYLWIANGEANDEIHIKCPEATRYCEPLEWEHNDGPLSVKVSTTSF